MLRHEGYHDADPTLAEARGWCVFGNFNTYVILGARAFGYDGGDGGAFCELRHIRNRKNTTMPALAQYSSK